MEPIITNSKSGVKQTLLTRSPIDDLPTKNPQRDVSLDGNGLVVKERTALYVAANPVLGYSEVVKKWGEDRERVLLNLMCDKSGNFLAAREIMYMTRTGKYARSTPKGYTSQAHLKELLDNGTLSKVTDYKKDKAISREATLKHRDKGYAATVVDFVIYVLNSSLMSLIKQSHHAFLVETNPNRKIFHHPNLTPRQNQIGQTALDIMSTDESFKDQLLQYETSILAYKEWQAINGITVDLLVTMISETLPGDQPGRKNKILTTLIKYFHLIPPDTSFSNIKPIKPLQPNHGLMLRSLTLLPDISSPTSERNTHASYTSERNTPSLVKLIPSEASSQEISKDTLTKTKDKKIIKPSGEVVKDTPESMAAQRYSAARALVHKVSPYVDAINKRIRENLKNYKDKDDIDTRQRAKMLNDISPIPLSYVSKSSNSPRVYSEEADNLFSCRKVMRKAALKGLGAVDVDIKSCHTYILMAKWPQQLPLLREAMEKGTLWEIYKTHYQTHGLPFHKKAVKAIHYASVLGGGEKAFKDAIHRHNLDNPDETIEDPKELIEVHKKSPIYKELKALLTHITKEWEGKHITLPTGERFKVKGFRQWRDKDTNTLIKKPGNLLTVLSAYLQSYEAMIMSSLILHSKDLYIPLLWQHDGLTIIPKGEHWLSSMTHTLTRIVHHWLGEGVDISLDITPMD